MTKKLTLSLLPFLMFFSISCGVVDTEQVSEIVAKKEEITQIRTQKIDPLLNKISDIENEVKPLENKIKSLEREKEKLFSEMEKLQGEKINEIRVAFNELKNEDRALIDELKKIDRELDNLKKEEGQAIKSSNEKKLREIKQEEIEIKQGFDKFKTKKNEGPPPEIKDKIDRLTEEFQTKISELKSIAKKKSSDLNPMTKRIVGEYEDAYQAKYSVLKERYEQLDKHRKNLSTQKKITQTQRNLDKVNETLASLGVGTGDENETVESLEKQIAALVEQISQTPEKITDPKWTAKLTDGSLKQGTPEYENHIKNETKITNPDWNDLNKQKSNKQRSLDRKNNNNNDEKTQNRIKDNTERKEKYMVDLAKFQDQLEEIGITGIDTSETDGEIGALESKITSLQEQILGFAEEDKTVQDPNWTDQLLVLTNEVDLVNQELLAAEETVNSIEVFIPDPNNPDALIQNPDYTSADANYAEVALKKSEKQQLYEAHIRNQGSIVNPDYQQLIDQKIELENALSVKESEKNSLLAGGSGEGSDLPDTEAAISRERSNLKEKMETMRRDHNNSKRDVQDQAKAESKKLSNQIKKDSEVQEQIIRKQYKVDMANLKAEASKKPKELIDLQERMFELSKVRNAIKDEGDVAKDKLTVKADEMLAQRKVIREKRDEVEKRRRILEDTRDEIWKVVIPVEESVKAIETELDSLFVTLSEAYELKKQTQKELQTIEREIEDLAREAESDILTLITDAMTAAEELENSSPLDFTQFQITDDEEEPAE
tara:strand:+ start:214 stop:2532 length:2319 start_codon:yes stop_codon:yes gene_type:complete